MSVTIFKTDPQIWEQATSKLDRTVQSLDEDVSILQDWLKTQPHLPDLLDSHSLRNFLFLNKFSIEITKQKLDNYYTLRKKFEEYYGKSNPKLPFQEEFCKTAYMVFYPKLTPEMYRLGYYKVKDVARMESYDVVGSLKRLLITMQDLRLRKDVMVGDVWVCDFEGSPISNLPKLTPALLYRCTIMFEKIYSNRIKAFYFINFPSFAATILSLMKKFMKPKLFERIHLLKDVGSIKQFITPDLLPKDFGGEGPSLSDLEDGLNNSFKEEAELFDRLDDMKIDESLRPEKLDNDDVLGVYGSFKKLDVD